MARKHSKRIKLLNRRRKTHRRHKGAGYSDGLPMVYPGGMTHQQFTGPGKDCAGVPQPPGFIKDYSYVNKGLPGMSPSMFGGATQLGSGGIVVNNQPKMKGGRYGFFPELGPLNSDRGIGTTPAPFLRVGCQTGSYNPLNPDRALQLQSTAVPSVNGWTQFASPSLAMSGGKRKKGKKCRKGSRKMRGGVYVGDVDAMRYYAPTAGYSNMPLAPPVFNNPGILMQVGYPARHFNSACMNTH